MSGYKLGWLIFILVDIPFLKSPYNMLKLKSIVISLVKLGITWSIMKF
jgi:hypothetical protein